MLPRRVGRPSMPPRLQFAAFHLRRPPPPSGLTAATGAGDAASHPPDCSGRTRFRLPSLCPRGRGCPKPRLPCVLGQYHHCLSLCSLSYLHPWCLIFLAQHSNACTFCLLYRPSFILLRCSKILIQALGVFAHFITPVFFYWLLFTPSHLGHFCRRAGGVTCRRTSPCGGVGGAGRVARTRLPYPTHIPTLLSLSLF
jgi:hypothetical protein